VDDSYNNIDYRDYYFAVNRIYLVMMLFVINCGLFFVQSGGCDYGAMSCFMQARVQMEGKTPRVKC